MTASFITRSMIFTAALIGASALAQTRYCIGGDLDHLSASERAACSASAQAVGTAATSMHAPQGWHFVVVCGEEGWKNYSAFSTSGASDLETAAADTDGAQQVTFFRESSLHTDAARSLRSVVAHEIASLVLKSRDEDAIRIGMTQLEHSGQVQEALLTR